MMQADVPGRAAALPARALSVSALQRTAGDLAGQALRDIGRSRMASVAYDSGFLARLTPLLPREPFVAAAARFLEATQHADGSWGSSVANVHDRALSTLSALAGLVRAGEKVTSARVDLALDWLGAAFPRLAGEPQLVGSDLLLPPLVSTCAQLGLDVDPKALPYRRVGRVAQALYGRVFYSGHPVGHLIELLGDRADADRLLAGLVTQPSGSVMCSPSATAFAIERAGRAEPRQVEFLRAHVNADGGSRHFGPYEVMEAAYSLYAMRGTPLVDSPGARRAARLLRDAWGPRGVAFSREFPAVDLDDSVLAALSIAATGERVAPDFLDRFAREDYFLCYLEDRRGAVGPNLHAIEALRVLAHPRREELSEVALRFVRARARPDGSFVDHYSVSPYYPTWHAIEALTGLDDATAARGALFIASTQRADGSWGPVKGAPPTAEDTAYAVLGLCAHARSNPREYADEITAGAAYLLAHAHEEPSATWVAKVLYSPTTMARAAVAGALAAAAQALGGAASLSPTAVTLEGVRPAGARALPSKPTAEPAIQRHGG